MIKTLSKKKCSVTIYSTSKKPGKIFNDFVSEIYIKNHPFSIIKYLDWAAKIYREINKRSYDYVLAGDLYSLLPLVLRKKNYKVIYDSREIYTQLSAHINNPIKKTVLFLDIEAWNKTGENCKTYLEKGSSVAIDGRLDIKQWVAKSGENKTKIFCVADNVHFLKNKDKAQPSSTKEILEEASNKGGESFHEDEDEVPF